MKIILISFLILWASVSLASDNFVGADDIYLQQAERSRSDIARFWTGRDLPKWNKPCQMEIRLKNQPGSGGCSVMMFDNYEAFGWRMPLEGTKDEILSDVIPHEVNHMVLGTIARRPIYTWIDEGEAQLFETEKQHRFLREQAVQSRYTNLSVWRHLDSDTYPKDWSNVYLFYGSSFSLIEYLLTKNDVEHLYRFTLDPEKPSIKLPKYYPDVTEKGWMDWLMHGPVQCRDCSIHSHKEPKYTITLKPGLPVLEVYYADWCIPCHRFWFDYNTDPAFRQAIEDRVSLFRCPDAGYRAQAQKKGITRYPSFAMGDYVQSDYLGKRWFISQIDRLLADNKVKDREPPVRTPSSEPTPANTTPFTTPSEPTTTPFTTTTTTPIDNSDKKEESFLSKNIHTFLGGSLIVALIGAFFGPQAAALFVGARKGYRVVKGGREVIKSIKKRKSSRTTPNRSVEVTEDSTGKEGPYHEEETEEFLGPVVQGDGNEIPFVKRVKRRIFQTPTN